MALPTPDDDWALFLDFDGTLVEIAATPDAVRVPAELSALLRTLSAALGGALAVVSGRRIADIDRFLDHGITAVAGLHGLERRDGAGHLHHVAIPEAELQAARERLTRFVGDRPGVLLEDKGASLGLHYRQAPVHGPACRDLIDELAAHSGGLLEAQRGKMIAELKTNGRHKGEAVREFLTEAPFRGRKPVFAGDDVTDEAAFAAVNALDGISIRVGPAGDDTAARFSVPDVAAFATWLQTMPGQLQTIGSEA